MNKSKLISVAVLCALTLSACVDDKESASVTALREAKTSYLKAQAGYQTAQAEVAKINAEVAKAKTEAEMAIAKLRAEAEAAKTEAETKEIQQRAEEAQKRFEAQLAAIEAKAKAEAAEYEARYQEYLNELSIAQRQAVLEQQKDLVNVIEKYKITLSDIREAENTISAKTLQIADLNRQKLEALAGNALASAKNAVLRKQAEISGYKIGLQEYQILHEADAAAQKKLIEKLREELPAQAEAVKAAQDKYLAVNDPIKTLEAQQKALHQVLNGYDGHSENGISIHFYGKLDTLGKAWEALNAAENDIHQKNIYNYIGYLGSYRLSNIQNIKYYSWEVDKLLTDMDKQLANLKADLQKADTLEVATNSLKALFAELEKAQTANEKANQELDKANEIANNALVAYNKAVEAYNAAVASGDQAKINAATTAKAKAEDALNKANEDVVKAAAIVNGKNVSGVYIPGTDGELQNIKAAYESKRSNNQNLEYKINNLKKDIESLEKEIELVKAAKEICFGDLMKEIVALDKEIETNNESLSKLEKEQAELYALYQIEKSKYDNNKSIVNDWDSAISGSLSNFLALVETRINVLQGNIATAEKELENLNEILADPKKLDQKYCDMLNNNIKQAEKELANAQDKLSTEKVKAATYKAAIDAWSTEQGK